jgi:hypothetical protein
MACSNTNVQSDQSHLTILPFRSGSDNQLGIQYAPQDEGVKSDLLAQATVQPKMIEAETLEKYTKHVINHSAESFEPRLLEINGRENRRSCVVVGEDGRQIRIYDLEAVDS